MHVILESEYLGTPQETSETQMAPTQVEIKLVELKNCFVNVPRSIVALLENANAVCSPVALVGYIANVSPGRPERCRRATVQGVHLDRTSRKKA